jgi:hypothetical protein
MTARKAAVGIVILLLLTLLGVGVVLIMQGDQPAVTGALVGVGLGGFGLCIESFGLSWAMKKKLSWTLGVSLGGFLLRLVLVVALTLVFDGVESVSAVTFALTYVASFLAFVGIQVWVVSRVTTPTPSTGPGQKEGEA